MSDRKRQLIVAAAAAVGLLLVFAVARRKSGPAEATYVAGSPDFGGAALGGGENDWSISGGESSGYSLADLVEAFKGLAPTAATPVNVTVTAPAVSSASPSQVNQPGPSSDPTPAPPAGNYRPPAIEVIERPQGGQLVVVATPQQGYAVTKKTGQHAAM